MLDSTLAFGSERPMGLPVTEFTYAFTTPEEYLNWVPEASARPDDLAVTIPAMYEALQNVYAHNAEGSVLMATPSSLSPPTRHHQLFRDVPPFAGNATFAAALKTPL